MGKEFLVTFLSLFVNGLMVLIFIRVLMSWVPNKGGKFTKVIYDLTEPILAPIRKFIPPIGGTLDLSPLIAFIILNILIELIARI